MKVTSTILSIPPYISTTWKNISSLHVREVLTQYTLIIILQNRVHVEVPGLSKEEVDLIFKAHAAAAEEESSSKKAVPWEGPFSFSLPLKADMPIENLGAQMQHNPEQANMPPIPPDVLKKITAIARAFGLEDSSLLSKPEPHCHCAYCQIVRSLQGETVDENSGEAVSEADLTFRTWDVSQTSENLYQVTNPLDANEHYNVFLGTPLGCTCGSKNCEHIRAVLNS